MNPPASSPAVRDRMRRQRVRDTAPELALRAALRARGVRGYRVHWPLPLPRRRADVAFPGPRLAVFVDGCWWHGCPAHCRGSRANAAWWRAKAARNRARDADTDARLRAAGWAVVRLWEHDDPRLAAALVAETLARRGPRGRRAA